MYPLKVCMFSNLFPPIDTGSSVFTWNIAKQLVKHNIKVAIVTAKIGEALSYEEKEGVSIHRIPAMQLPPIALAHNFKWMSYTYIPNNIRWLKELFNNENFDIIHQQNHIFDTILSSSHMAKYFDLPLILTVHTWAQHPNPLYDKVLALLDGLSRKVVFDKSDVVVSPDPVVKKYVEGRHKVTHSPVIPYGIEVTKPSFDSIMEIKQRFQLGDGPIILSLGHVNALRDRIDLITAMPQILEKFPNCKLLIVGEVYVNEPIETVKRLKIENSVIFTGAISHEKIPALFAISDIEAHTFNGPYPGPGIASMEAMTAGLPVVTGKISEEFDFSHLRDWENVVMVQTNSPNEMGQAIIRLLSDKALRFKIGENAKRMMLNNYSWDSVCRSYIDIYQQEVEKRSEKKVIVA